MLFIMTVLISVFALSILGCFYLDRRGKRMRQRGGARLDALAKKIYCINSLSQFYSILDSHKDQPTYGPELLAYNGFKAQFFGFSENQQYDLSEDNPKMSIGDYGYIANCYERLGDKVSDYQFDTVAPEHKTASTALAGSTYSSAHNHHEDRLSRHARNVELHSIHEPQHTQTVTTQVVTEQVSSDNYDPFTPAVYGDAIVEEIIVEEIVEDLLDEF